MPSRQTQSNRAQRRAADTDTGAWARLQPLLQRLGWGAREVIAVIAGSCAAVAIIVNALFLQRGPHPAPFFNSPPPLDLPAETSVAVAVPRARPPDPSSPPVRSAALPAKRVIAMQRALAQFGYGQIKPTGVIDGETRAAIEKFEREHKLPVTGQLSERLTRAIAAMTGRSLE